MAHAGPTGGSFRTGEVRGATNCTFRLRNQSAIVGVLLTAQILDESIEAKLVQ